MGLGSIDAAFCDGLSSGTGTNNGAASTLEGQDNIICEFTFTRGRGGPVAAIAPHRPTIFADRQIISRDEGSNIEIALVDGPLVGRLQVDPWREFFEHPGNRIESPGEQPRGGRARRNMGALPPVS